MPRFLRQCLRALRRVFQKKRQPAKTSRREYHTALDFLERRDLFSLNAWLLPGQGPIGRVAQTPAALQVFQAATIQLTPPPGTNPGSVAATASFSFTDTGTYQLTVQESANTPDGTFSFSTSGPVTFSLVELGNLTTAGLSLNSVVLTQNAQLDWAFEVDDDAGNVLASGAGTDSVFTQSLGSVVLDGTFWEGFNWYDPTQQLLSDQGLGQNLAGGAYLTVGETGAENYFLQLLNGQETLTAAGTQALTNFLASGQQAESFTLAAAFSYTNQGADTFSLFEQGAQQSTSDFDLGSVLYSETGNPDNGSGLGYDFQFGESGQATESGTGNDLGSPSFPALDPGLNGTQSQSFQFASVTQEYNYSEGGSGVSFSLKAGGVYGQGTFSLDGVDFAAQGAGAYSATLSRETSAWGNYWTSGSDTISLGNPGLNDFQAGDFRQDTDLTQTETGAGPFALSGQGAYTGGNMAWANLSLTEAAEGSFLLSSVDSYSATGSGALTDVGSGTDSFLQNGGPPLGPRGAPGSAQYVITEDYTSEQSYTDATSLEGPISFSLTQATASDGSLSCYLSTSSLSVGAVGSSASWTNGRFGTGSALVSGTDAGPTAGGASGAGLGSSSFTTDEEFSFATSQNSSYSWVRGGLSLATVLAGPDEGYSLESWQDSWQAGGTDAAWYAGTRNTTVEGFAPTPGGDSLGGTVTGPGADSFTRTSTGTFDTSYNDTFTSSGTDSASFQEQGLFNGPALESGTVLNQQATVQTGTDQASGTDSFTTWATTTFTSTDPAANGTPDEVDTRATTTSDSWNQTTTSGGTATLYESGSFDGQAYTLGSVAYTEADSSSGSSQVSTSDSDAGTDSWTTSGVGVLGLASTTSGDTAASPGTFPYFQTGSDSFTLASAETVTGSSWDSSSLSERGAFAAGSFSFPSVVYQDQAGGSETDQTSGQESSLNTVDATTTFTSGVAGPDAPPGVASTSLGQLTEVSVTSDHPAATASFTQTATTSFSSTLYEAGSYGGGSFAFGSVSYGENDSSTGSGQTYQSTADSGSDSLAVSFTGTDAGGDVTGGSVYSESYAATSASTVVQNTSGTSVLTEAGSYANGSYGFGAWLSQATQHTNGTTQDWSVTTFSGGGADSFAAAGTLSAADSYGLTVFQGPGSASSGGSDSYTVSGTRTLGQLTFTTTDADYTQNVGTGQDAITYQTSSAATWSLTQGNQSLESEAQSSFTSGTAALAGDSGTGSIAFFQSGSDTLSQASNTTLTQAGTASSSLYEKGDPDSGGYNLSSVVYRSGLSVSGTYQSYATDSYSHAPGQGLSTTSESGSAGADSSTAAGAASSYALSSWQYSTSSGMDTLTTTEAITNSQGLFEEGTQEDGVSAWDSLVLSPSSSDSLSTEEDRTQTQTGVDGSSLSTTTVSPLTADGSLEGTQQLTATHTQGDAFILTSVSTLLKSSYTGSSNYQAGSEDPVLGYAFDSLTYQTRSNSLATFLQFTTDSYSGTGGDSITSSGSLSEGTDSSVLAGLSWSSLATYQRGGSDTVLLQDYQAGSASLYEAGGEGSDYSLDSVNQFQGSRETTLLQEQSGGTQSGTLTTSGADPDQAQVQAVLSLGTLTGSQGSLPASQGSFQQGLQTVAFQNDTTATSLSEQGSYANGAFAFPSVVYQQQQSSLQTVQTTATDSSILSNADPNGPTPDLSNPGPGGIDLLTQASQDTLLNTEVSGTTVALYEDGALAGGAFAFSSVAYRLSATDSLSWSAVNSFSSTETASGLATFFNGTQGPTAQGAFSSWLLTTTITQRGGGQTQTLNGFTRTTLSEQGSSPDGSQFSFASVLYQDQSAETATVVQNSLSTVNQTQLGGGLTLVFAAEGVSADGVGTAVYTGTQSGTAYRTDAVSSSETAFDSLALTEGGTGDGTHFAFSSVVYDGFSRDSYTGLETAVLSQTLTQDSLYTFTPGAAQSASLAASLETAATQSSLETAQGGVWSQASYTLHEEGSLDSAGYALSCVLFDSGSGYTMSESNYQSQAGGQVLTAAGSPTDPASVSLATTVLTSQAQATLLLTGTYTATSHAAGSYDPGDGYALSSLVQGLTFQGLESYTAFSGQTTLYQDNTGQAGTVTSSDNLACYQQAGATLTESGTAANLFPSLSSAVLASSDSLTATETFQQYNQDSGPAGEAVGTLNWSTGQYQNVQTTEWGTDDHGSLAVAGASFQMQEGDSFTYQQSGNELYGSAGGPTLLSALAAAADPTGGALQALVGGTGGSDSYTQNASGSSSYQASGVGTFDSYGNWGLSSFALHGGSAGTSSYRDAGSLGTTSFNHADDWNETNREDQEGSYNGGWSFSLSTATQAVNEQATDSVGSNYASTTYSDTVSTSGTGPTGTRTEVQSITYQWGMGTHYSGFNQSAAAALTAWLPAAPVGQSDTSPALSEGSPPAQAFTQVASGGLGPVSAPALGQSGGQAAQLLGPSVGAAPSVAVAGPGGGVLRAPGGLGLALTWQGRAAAQFTLSTPLVPSLTDLGPTAKYWLNTNYGLNASSGSWAWSLQLRQGWSNAGRSSQAAWQRTVGGRPGPTALSATALWQQQQATLPDGGWTASDFWAKLGAVIDFVAGIADTVTLGWTARLRAAYGLDGLVDTSSSAYQLGSYVGIAAGLVLMVSPVEGALGEALVNAALNGAIANTVEAFVQGRWSDFFRSAAAVVLLGLASSGTSLCELPVSLQVVGRGFLLAGGVSAGAAALQQFQSGNVLGGVLSLFEAGIDLGVGFSACFAAEMLVDLEGGKKRADTIEEGDRLWSRDQLDPEGPLALKVVQAVFVRVAPIWTVRVAGQELKTTAEHPFFVQGQGWVAAKFLRVGDLLRTRSGLLVPVEAAADSGRVETVYNWRIADFHTYFVSATDEGASIWGHNSYTALKDEGLTKSQAKRANMLYKTQGEAAARAYFEGQGFSGSRLDTLVNAAGTPHTGAQRGPNGTSGHAATIRAEAERLAAEGNTIIAGGGGRERTIQTPGGFKETRRPDILYRTPEGELRGVNVGRRMADGNPVPRELEALADLNGPGKLPTTFLPYN